jgi:3-deoxy-D-manno-octulosonate 8-phosphate phosphatase (KDO 8-P phosphatase)
MEQSIVQRAKKIKLIILDVDGVLTDGSIVLDNDVNEFKSFNVRDGYAIKRALNAGYTIALITGRYSKVVQRRADELGITEVYQGSLDKNLAYQEILTKYRFAHEEAAFMGDDVIDLVVMKQVGLPASPQDGDSSVIKEALFVSKNNGGRGAVREFIEFILKSTGKWD